MIQIIEKDKVLVEKIDWEEITASGLILVESEENKQDRKLFKGRVIACGPEVLSVKVGQEVCFTCFVGKGIYYGGKDCVLMREKDLDGVWN